MSKREIVKNFQKFLNENIEGYEKTVLEYVKEPNEEEFVYFFDEGYVEKRVCITGNSNEAIIRQFMDDINSASWIMSSDKRYIVPGYWLKLDNIDRFNNALRFISNEGDICFNASLIEKELPENMRYKEINNSLANNGGIYWVTHEKFRYKDLLKFQEVMNKFGIPKAYVTVRDLSWSYDFAEDFEKGTLVEITKDTINYDKYNDACRKYACYKI